MSLAICRLSLMNGADEAVKCSNLLESFKREKEKTIGIMKWERIFAPVRSPHDLMRRSCDTVAVRHMIRLHYEFLIIQTVWEFPSLIVLNWENMLGVDGHL